MWLDVVSAASAAAGAVVGNRLRGRVGDPGTVRALWRRVQAKPVTLICIECGEMSEDGEA
jgi:hypothetical protein